jgi:putative two-component system response regulator
MRNLSQNPAAQVLVVDDAPPVRDLLSRWLRDEGYSCATAASAADAWAHLQQHPVDLVTLDISMPDGSGLDLLDRIRQALPDTAAIMLTAEGDTTKAIRALTAGAYGYLIKPIARQELVIQVRNALERRRLVIENREYTHELEDKVREQTRAIRMAHEESIHRLVKASLYRDEETGDHIRRTGRYSELLSATLGWDPERVEQIRLAAPMHDIGKIAIPDAILCKPGKLTSAEFAVMKTHAALGARLLAGSQSPVLRMAHQIALGHHERWDGSGYPSGLHGTEIPEVARIVAIVDVYDALSHDRIYRPALPESEVLKILRAGRGSHFDPELLDVFMSLLPEMRTIAQTVTDCDEEEPGDDAVEASATDLVLAPAVAAL